MRYWSSEDERRDFCEGLVRMYRACLSICGQWSIYRETNKRRYGEKKDLGYPRPQERPHKEFEPLEFGLDDDEAEIGFRIHVACLCLHQVDLPVPIKRSVSDKLQPASASLYRVYLLPNPLHHAFH